MRRWKWIMVLGLVFVLAGGGWLVASRIGSVSGTSQAQGTSVGPTVQVQRGDVVQILTVNGEAIARDEATFTFSTAKLIQLRVSEGDVVEKDQVLAVLDSAQEELALLQATRALAEAQAKGVPSEVREKELAYAIAKANYEATTIRAPFKGVVTTIGKSEGQYQIVILDLGSLFIVGNVSELDVRHLAVGQRGRAMFDALPGQVWPVEVVKVGGQAVKSGAEKVVKVTFRIIQPSSAILPGFSARVDLTVAEARGVLRVPVSALIQLPQGWAVAVVKDGKTERRMVEIGVVSEFYAEIKKGLSEGEEILVNAGQAGSALQQTSPRQMPPGGEVMLSPPAP